VPAAVPTWASPEVGTEPLHAANPQNRQPEHFRRLRLNAPRLELGKRRIGRILGSKTGGNAVCHSLDSLERSRRRSANLFGDGTLSVENLAFETGDEPACGAELDRGAEPADDGNSPAFETAALDLD
jgi:hypothetical protein